MANFEFELRQELKMTICWEYPLGPGAHRPVPGRGCAGVFEK